MVTARTMRHRHSPNGSNQFLLVNPGMSSFERRAPHPAARMASKITSNSHVFVTVADSVVAYNLR
jgi:hypothetical protein